MMFRTCWPLALSVLLAVASPAWAQSESKTYSVTAVALSRAVFAGIRIGAEAALRDGKATADTLACVSALDDASLAPVYDRVMRELLSDEDIRKLDGFYGSEAGGRFYRWSLNELRSQQKLPIREPIELSEEEISRANAFHASGPGLVLNGIGAPGSASEKTVTEAIVAALAPCQP